MKIKAQDGTEYDIYTFSTESNCVYCQDNADRRRKRLLGEYNNSQRATEIFLEIRKCVDGCYEMPQT